MDNFAPVLIPTLNRYEHFRRCVESLSSCTHADKTDLFIAFDYPLNDSHWAGYMEIDKYLPTIQGFKSIHVIRRENNYGARENIQASRKVIFEKYERMIFSEDDNEFSPNFLDYINKGLDKFEDDDRVLAICGYMYPVSINCSKEYNYFFGKGFSGWGYGVWKNRNFKTSYTVSELKKLVKNKDFVRKIKYYDERHYFNMLGYIEKKQDPTGDRAIVIQLIEQNLFCIFPIVSKVRNWGHDGSGVNCDTVKDNPFISQKIDYLNCFDYSDKIAINNSHFDSLLRRYFEMTLKKKFKFFIKRSIIFNWLYKNRST